VVQTLPVFSSSAIALAKAGFAE